MIQNSMYPAVESAYPVYNPMFKEFSNERLYEALCAATAPLDAGLEELPASPQADHLERCQGFPEGSFLDV